MFLTELYPLGVKCRSRGFIIDFYTSGGKLPKSNSSDGRIFSIISARCPQLNKEGNVRPETRHLVVLVHRLTQKGNNKVKSNQIVFISRYYICYIFIKYNLYNIFD